MLKNNYIHAQFGYSRYFCSVLSSKEDFLMTLQSSPVRSQATKAGTCPHGMPLGACPLCNGMAGGNSTSKRDIPRNAGEMTYNQCAAIGAMLRAQKAAKLSAKQAQQSHEQALIDFQKNITNTHQRLMNFAAFMDKNFPKIISTPINFLAINIAGNVLNFVKNMPVILGNFIQNFSQKFVDISDKIAAIYGEIELATQEKLANFISDFKKKFKFKFFVFGTGEAEDEEKKIEEEKRTFELKTFIHKLYKKIKQKTEKDNKKHVHESNE